MGARPASSKLRTGLRDLEEVWLRRCVERLLSIRRRLTIVEEAAFVVLVVAGHSFDYSIHVVPNDFVLHSQRAAFPTRRGGEYIPLVTAKGYT